MLRTSIAQISELVTDLGVRPGDTAVIHSALFSLGRIEGGVAGFNQALRNVVGPEGTLIVPTFTYSFRRGQVFDVKHSPPPAELGAYSNHLWRQPHAVRSADPLLSMAAMGPKAASLMRRTSLACLGDGSVYASLFAADVVFVAIGITYSTGLAAFMHVEKLAGVDYRRDTTFHGTTIDATGRLFEDSAIHYARDEARYPQGRTDREAMGRAMEQRGFAKAVEYGSGRHVAVRAQPMQDFVLSELNRDPHIMFLADGGGDRRKVA